MNNIADVLIIGAGLAGLMTANSLASQGIRVKLLDKGRSVGGRLATRRIGPGRADHGAQFFTVRTPQFQAWVDLWLAEGLVYRWSTGWAEGSLDTAPPDGHPRYAVRGGMNALAKHLTRGLDARTAVYVVRVSLNGETWLAESDYGQTYSGRALVLTLPTPQSLALLDAGGVPLEQDTCADLERIEYAPCLAGMFWVDGPVHLPEPGAIQNPDPKVSWIADNQRKGISPEATIITVHATPEQSRRLWEAPEAAVLDELGASLEPFLDRRTRILEVQLKRWRYALPTTFHSERCLVAGHLPGLIFAGDAFGGPRIEGAALSGLFASESLGRNLGWRGEP